MCNYRGYEFGAGAYPDSVCIDGELHDADRCDGEGNLLVMDEEIPCPICRPTDAVGYQAEQQLMAGDVDLQEAMAMAASRVTHIRANRGVLDEFAMPAASSSR